ncbi:carbonic anhydrase family protein [Mesobacillus maritimus]|uniref:carbonic anhydrase n=1 Tax=Mesobacillus maritimus TaxID=1643336 RepID=UPI00203EF952|nr:carbonic anhydrase family protein [Mesobacillus maritimus]MCM3670875.1 carbonic anhydrase family protein [Mesobacillus maritimus]
MTMKNFIYFIILATLLLMTACTPKAITSSKEIEVIETEAETDNSTPVWSYKGENGPDQWANVDSSFADCADGTEQSPIDIELANVKVDKSAAEVDINYSPTAFTLMNNSHTIQANDGSEKNTITVDGEEYTLVQMHFHKPSEHQLDGQAFEMEGHLVHQNDEGELAVLGFLISEGKENQVLAEMWSKLPEEETEEDVPLDQAIDLANFLPEDKSFFRYNGSLTTPACSEGVSWILLEEPIEMSREQIDAFGSIFPHNSRPVQPINEREVTKTE